MENMELYLVFRSKEKRSAPVSTFTTPQPLDPKKKEQIPKMVLDDGSTIAPTTSLAEIPINKEFTLPTAFATNCNPYCLFPPATNSG